MSVMDPQQKAVAEEFDQYQTSYKDAVNNALSFSGLNVDFFTRVKTDYMIDLLKSAFGSTEALRVLDVGCGVGNYHALLRDQFNALAGVDVSAACIETAKQNHPDVEYQVYDGTRLPYDDASFDVAFTICVIHHVPTAQWPAFVAEMGRVLRPGGMALVFEHNPRNPLTMRVVNRCPFDKDAVLLNAHEARALFSTPQFSDVETRHILTVPALNGLLRRVDSAFGALPLGAQYYLTARKAAA